MMHIIYFFFYVWSRALFMSFMLIFPWRHHCEVNGDGTKYICLYRYTRHCPVDSLHWVISSRGCRWIVQSIHWPSQDGHDCQGTVRGPFRDHSWMMGVKIIPSPPVDANGPLTVSDHQWFVQAPSVDCLWITTTNLETVSGRSVDSKSILHCQWIVCKLIKFSKFHPRLVLALWKLRFKNNFVQYTFGQIH